MAQRFGRHGPALSTKAATVIFLPELMGSFVNSYLPSTQGLVMMQVVVLFV
jgi:hypothetical protein